MIEDVITNSEDLTEFMVVDFDKNSLDRSILTILREPHAFQDVAALADIYRWDAVYDSKRVMDVFEAGSRFAKHGP